MKKKKPVKPALRQGREQLFLQTLRCIRDDAQDWLDLPPAQQGAAKGVALVKGIFSAAFEVVKENS